MSEDYNRPHRSEPPVPWWKNGDDAASVVASIIFVGFGIFVVMLFIILGIKIGQWVL